MTRRPPLSRWVAWAAAGAVVIGGALWARSRLASYEPQEYTGPTLPAPTHVARVGERPSPIILRALSGASVAIGGPAPRRRLIHFWASWCLPCVAELPSFERSRKAFEAAGVELVTVALDDYEHAEEIVTRGGLTFPVLFSEGASVDPVAAFGSGQCVVPFNVLLDANGLILRQKVGTMENGAADVLHWVTTDS